jgi:predicted RNA binding protein YcfA (HicA-like mRNA interferase family)
MLKLPRVTAREIVAGLRKAGFSRARKCGSDMIFNNGAGKRVTVHFHAAKILHPKLLRDAEISVERIDDLL